MKKFFILIVSFAVIALKVSFAQNDNTDTPPASPIQITFVTPLGTNGAHAPGISNVVSLNILVGVNGGVEQFELGGLLNINNGDVTGAQISGFGNIVNGAVNGFQMGGFANINSGAVNGFQAAGFINIVDDNAEDFQVAGFANITKDYSGFQVSGFGNYTEESDGFQGGGFMNIATKVTGAQIAGFMNVAEETDGIQAAGFMNIADRMKGVQIAGFLNICDTIDGIPIAPISIVKKGGYRKFEFWGNETFFMNTSFRIGVPVFYTIFTLGYKPGYSEFNWGYGFGAGTSFAIGTDHSVDLEAHVYHINSRSWRNWDYNQLNQLRINFNYQIAEHFSIVAGPTFNLLISENLNDANKISPAWAFDILERKNILKGWFGFNFGFRF
ncbi:MAG: hypothetical protein JXB00_06045 [Bacteroidales bacterium]|nr:hypothetical protein [Bacteroidales bacterium]